MTSIGQNLEAEIAFLNDDWRDRDELPQIYSRETRHRNTTRRPVFIHDARPLQDAGELDLDGSGFVLVRHATQFSDFGNKAAIHTEYFPEMKGLIRDLTGADEVFEFPFYQVRSRSPDNFFDAYSLYLHCDYSANTWLQSARQVIRNSGSSKEYHPDKWDFALYNLWRPIHHEVQQDPLVLADARTVDARDIIDYRLSPKDDSARAALPVFNERQRFYYVPRMQTDEVLVFKQLDSRPDCAQVCPHTSFRDPHAPATASERQSIEVRMMCLFRKRTQRSPPGALLTGVI